MAGTDLGLDLVKGCGLALAEMYGDWYRDPWAWPEYQWLQSHPASLSVSDVLRKEDGVLIPRHPTFFHPTEVPKNRLAVRPAVLQDSLSRILYTTAVASNMEKMHRSLPDWVYGWRSRNSGIPSKNRLEWASYLDSIPTNPEEGQHGLQVDISSFFASIRVEDLSEMTFERIGKTASAGVIASVIRQHDALATRSGIPQRSFASAALAHLYLGAVDDALGAASNGGLALVTRWMDDITALGSEPKLYSAYLDIQDRIRHLGMEPNAAKTKLTSAEEAIKEVRFEGTRELAVPKSVIWAQSGAPTVVEDIPALKRVEEALLAHPDDFSRTWHRATLTALMARNVFENWEHWISAAPKIPHAVDSLGRYLRRCGEHDEENPTVEDFWAHLEEWFPSYCNSDWARVDWVCSQLALAFPVKRVTEPVRRVLRSWLADSGDAQKVAIATQRLSSVAPVECRDIIRGRLDKTSDPLLLRIFALGLLTSGAGRSVVRPILERDPRNLLVSLMLEDRGWRAPVVAEDFDAGHDE
ncbi:RNA-directed DNA polymerase [Micromonospora sp. NBS 11-29]|uniref:RNA-directed DNA polymerase n=1 Tax=Micromonospora sp. NBS 11-29 TaxID=1960879 RepID=UPI000B772EC5|nr:RNA-directed DNA polymerase [Micromonospora sp. NBS 11-29]